MPLHGWDLGSSVWGAGRYLELDFEVLALVMSSRLEGRPEMGEKASKIIIRGVQ